MNHTNLGYRFRENSLDSKPLSEITLPLHRIIPFSNVEGMGNRTSIFLQGCKLNCLYCHNPETIPRYTDESKKVSLDYLFQQVMDAVPFIRGVTVSGGEPTIHYKKLVPLFNALKEQGLTCYLDSCGFFDYDKTAELIEVTDKFLFDLKGIGDGLQTLCFDRKNQAGKVPTQLIPTINHIKKENLQRNLENLEKLLKLDKVEEIRLVMINGFFDEKLLIEKVAQLNPPKEVIFKIIRVHNKGTRDPDGLAPYIPTTDEIDHLANYAKQCGFENVVKIY
ncbi:radical SAM protein [Phocoenobacter skyensis]|uniref:Pyruvate-formate lyase-activating enzyme n=1 Tax=Phocoenobacter skyensis TaxID=97481 RepID=A0A1H7Y1B7_9PAST|nr:radical SAM protein [Pasteurella skyensis]MDP8079790.1 radical SAM protein [Pasteurella skyensis]MDP8085741.1 radical SAM protein [Pasteurella skyensis]MDP8185569.1 radical SAM protein [Pasteurella skyensis]QLB21826.1 radical SAM protein [Pasteurella skyensis]SEM39148.1 Pyruvate-formate lyase-activating enzyme [Pasteurella skyensis]